MQRALDEQLDKQKASRIEHIRALLVEMDKKMLEKEATYQKQIDNLEAMVKTLSLDIKSLQQGSLYWRKSFTLESPPLYLQNGSQSYVSVAASKQSQSHNYSRDSRVLFDLAPPQSSLLQSSSPIASSSLLTTNTTLRSALQSTANKRE